MVFQDYALFPHLTVAENVVFGLAAAPAAEREARVAEVLELVGLPDLRRPLPARALGGQQQRVALARALAPQPAIVCLDEPWSAIDPLLRAQMRDELAPILRAAGTTALLVTHDQEEALALADRVALMRDGGSSRSRPRSCSTTGRSIAGRRSSSAPRTSSAAVSPRDARQTALGALAGRDRRLTGECEVLVRPELVGLAPTEAGDARRDPARVPRATTCSTASGWPTARRSGPSAPSNERVADGRSRARQPARRPGRRLPLKRRTRRPHEASALALVALALLALVRRSAAAASPGGER